ncbi:MAG TPA: hypothetical protein VH560_06110 [Polyangia bacterium]|jgi:hypothetical protein|nr:hypothetical protein [Polyangia bacterium]
MDALWRLFLLASLGLGFASACHRDTALGLPDAYLVYTPVVDGAGAAQRSAGGLPLFDLLALDDQRATSLNTQIAVGIVGEMLRTDYLAKQLVRDVAFEGKTFPASARAAARQPTVLAVGRGLEPFGAGFAVKGFFGGATDRAGIPWVGLKEDVGEDRAMPQTVTGLLARETLSRVVAGPPSLVDGYVHAMEVIAREWRVGQGPQGAVAPDAGTGTQRALFAGVRENSYAAGADGAPRSAAELLADPGLAATVIYRLAQSKAVGRHVAPADVYAPFVSDRVPPGVSPAAVLGPFRNFQAKLLTAWGRAVLAGTPPKDIADLVEAYGRAMPAERAEALRIFVVTTYGATVKSGGVKATAASAEAALPELTALAAEVASGRRSIRAALTP